MSDSLLLEAKGLTKRFGGLVAVSEVDFALGQGQIVGLIGPNGAGKSTVFNTLSGFYRADGGSVVFKGRDITRRKPYEICREGIARTFQIPRPFSDLPVIDNVTAAALYGRGSTSGIVAARKRGLETLAFVGLARKRDALARSLPLMDRKRLELARALATQPELLLLDEVFAGLTEAEAEEAIALIRNIRRELGITVFMIEHVMKTVMATCENIIVMHYGKKIAEGRPGEVAHNPAVIAAYLGQG